MKAIGPKSLYFVQEEIFIQVVPPEHKAGYNDWNNITFELSTRGPKECIDQNESKVPNR